MREVLDELDRRCRAGEAVAVGTVVSTFRSAPRPPGASMLVAGDGTVAGSVSGGCVEGAVYELAQDVIACGPGLGRTPDASGFVRALVDRANASRIISAIFKTTQTFQQNLCDIALCYCTNNSTHNDVFLTTWLFATSVVMRPDIRLCRFPEPCREWGL